MTLVSKLTDFAGAVSSAATYAPDSYPDWGYVTYEGNMADIKDLWSEIQPKLNKNIDEAKFIDAKLHVAYEAFETGEKEVGQNAMWEIYNLGVKTLR